MKNFNSISVIQVGKYQLKITNPTDLELIGKGAHGAVFKLSSDRCVKIFANKRNAMKEANAYIRIQGSPIAPKFYEGGSNYIIIEYIEGINLKDELRNRGSISEIFADELLFILDEMKRLGFTELDFELQNVFRTKAGEIKVVDYVKSYHRKSHKPKTLFKGLYKLGLLDSFLLHVKNLNPRTYLNWKGLMTEYFK